MVRISYHEAVRSAVSRVPDFSQLSTSFCDEIHPTKNEVKMFDTLQEKMEKYWSANEGLSVQFHHF